MALAWLVLPQLGYAFADYLYEAAPLNSTHYPQLLNEHSPHEVHLYEADDRPGGHANTVHVTSPGKEPIDVDTYVLSQLHAVLLTMVVQSVDLYVSSICDGMPLL